MQEVTQAFEWGQLLGPLGGTLALSLGSGMAMGWKFRAKQDKVNREYMDAMLKITNEKLEAEGKKNAELDKMCQDRINALSKRQDIEINAIRAAHKDEVETLRSILENVMNRLDKITQAK